MLPSGAGTDATHSAPPGVDDLATLVAGIARTGVRAGLTVTGPAVALDDGPGLAVYRLVQESMTNALKHAAASAIDVRLEYGPERLRVVVSDDGRPAASEDEPGHGLAGMRERIEAYGGRVCAGPRTGGGFEVEAVLPLTVAAS